MTRKRLDLQQGPQAAFYKPGIQCVNSSELAAPPAIKNLKLAAVRQIEAGERCVASTHQICQGRAVGKVLHSHSNVSFAFHNFRCCAFQYPACF